MNKLAGNFLICWLGWGIPMGLLFSEKKPLADGYSLRKTGSERIRSISIRTKDGAEEEFIVNDRREWIAFVKEKCGM